MKTKMMKSLTKILFAAFLGVFPAISMAQSGSQAKSALTQVNTELKGIMDTVSTLALIISAIIATVGVIAVLIKVQQGDNQAAKSIGSWFGAILFVSLAIGVIIKAFFL